MTHGQWWHVFRSNLVDGGNVNVLFEESHKQRRQRSKDQIKAGQHQFVVERLLHTGRRERVRKTREEEFYLREGVNGLELLGEHFVDHPVRAMEGRVRSEDGPS